MTNTKKRIFSGVLLAIFLFIIILGFFAFAFPKKEQGILKAESVDTAYYFHSSDTYYIASVVPSNQVVPIMFSGDNSCVNNVLTAKFQLYLSYVTSGYTYVDYYSCDYIQQYVNSDVVASGDTNTDFVIAYDAKNTFYTRYVSTDTASVTFYVYAETGFNSNVYSVTLGVSSTCLCYPNGKNGYKFFNISYFADNGKQIMYSFLVPTNFKYATRTYYLAGVDNLTESQQYSAGYQQGLTDNQQNVYNEGYSAGRMTGYNSGYSAGVANANNYSFATLLGSVVDAPVNAFKSMFNFEILGVNLLDFLLGLFTIAVVITIIKYIKGGK